MLDISHPFTEEDAEAYVYWCGNVVLRGTILPFGVEPKDKSVLIGSDTFIGCITLQVFAEHQRAELGYWLGRDYRSDGYTTEAARRVVQYGFEEMALHRIYAHGFSSNIASIRVMEKCGLKYEGMWRDDVVKPDGLKDVVTYGLLRREWQNEKAPPG
jgi:RimJ/RimL family protein N-acetyltransferase